MIWLLVNIAHVYATQITRHDTDCNDEISISTSTGPKAYKITLL